MHNKNVVVTTRIPEELRRELRIILMKNGVTVQDFLADTIIKYVRDNSVGTLGTIDTNAEIAATKEE
jgi:hypothetical protein